MATTRNKKSKNVIILMVLCMLGTGIHSDYCISVP